VRRSGRLRRLDLAQLRVFAGRDATVEHLTRKWAWSSPTGFARNCSALPARCLGGCKDILTLEHHGTRTLPNLKARIGMRLLVLSACIRLNHQLGRQSRALTA
jgi:hypothetical protein